MASTEELFRELNQAKFDRAHISGEDPADRATHLLTRCDEAGQFLEAA
ncbi:hypothetical protein [Sphingopyxis sp. Root1497]|nr:hypothetical protein [Sphingopyxis sp. Root1497]